MNQNIEKLGKNIYAVSFGQASLGWIKEFQDFPEDLIDAAMTVSKTGDYILNKDNPKIKEFLPCLVAVMKLKDSMLYTKKGFCFFFRELTPNSFIGTKKNPMNEKILEFIIHDSSVSALWTIYENCCKCESERRKIRKGVKTWQVLQQVFS